MDTSTMINPHAQWMYTALEQAHLARALSEVPVGAVVVAPDGKTLLGSGHNRTLMDHDPAGHAEIIALRIAAQNQGAARLVDCTLYVTLEPCPMCAGAIVQARIARLVFGAYDPKFGAVSHGIQLFARAGINHHPEVISGICERECSDLLREFFREKR